MVIGMNVGLVGLAQCRRAVRALRDHSLDHPVGIGGKRTGRAGAARASLGLAFGQVGFVPGTGRERRIIRRLGRLAQLLFQFGNALFEADDGRSLTFAQLGQRSQPGKLRIMLRNNLGLRQDHQDQIIMRKRAKGCTVHGDSESKSESMRKQNLAD